MLKLTEQGLYCEAGGFHIDPWRPVEKALITHAHSDHARAGHKAYLCAEASVDLLRLRLGANINVASLAYGESIELDEVRVSFHPAGHVLGSAQIRLEHHGESWVVSGDFKTQADPTCGGFEPVPCHTFVTECTFGLPIYRWPDAAEVFNGINDWWSDNQRCGRTSVLFGYSLGKAQRLLAGVNAALGPIFVHSAIRQLLPAYHAAGVVLPTVADADPGKVRSAEGRAMVIAPPAASGSPWLDDLGDVSTAFASGWMQIRGTRRRQGADRGFVLSDHADWPGLISAIRATGATRILATHGFTDPLVRWLNENGWQAEALATRFGEDTEDIEHTTNQHE
jgi:putative mRNA 3-end processing factor